MIFEQHLTELSALDGSLKQTAMGDLPRLTEQIGRRTALVHAAAAEIARLRQAGSAPPAGAQAALEQSSREGMQAIRQIILAKHLLATELGRLKQEQRMLEALAGGENQLRSSVEIHA